MDVVAGESNRVADNPQYMNVKFSARRACITAWGLMLGGMLLFTGLAKAHDPVDTQRVLAAWLEYTVHVDGRAGTWAVWMLVLVEVVLGAWLVSGIRPRAALIAGGSLLLGFIVWLISAREVVGELGCGSSLPSWLGDGFGLAITRNLVLLGIAVLCVLAVGRPRVSR